MNRTIENLRNVISDKIYIYCDNEKIGKQFMRDAENEGYRFGKIKPTENGWSNIVALERNKQLSFVGFCGHMAFQCSGGNNGNLTRIDYKKYAKRDKDFIFKGKPLNETTVKNTIHGDIILVGEDCFEAAVKLKELLSKYNEADDIDAICDVIESKYDVIVITEED